MGAAASAPADAATATGWTCKEGLPGLVILVVGVTAPLAGLQGAGPKTGERASGVRGPRNSW